ncbi:MAG: hypothetical protein EOO54_23760, partial [Haliea sp.]
MPISRTDTASRWILGSSHPPRMIIEEGRHLLRLALPIMLIALVNMGMSVTDTWMVSVMFGAQALAAVAVGSDLYSIVFYLGAGVLGGLTPLYTAAVVKAHARERARLERIGCTVVVLLALILVPVVWWAPDWLGVLGLDAMLLEQGRGYTRAMALTLVPMLGVVLYRTILTAAEKPQVFLKVTLAMLPLNAAANWVLMAGFGPIPPLGPAGAGVATLIVAATSLAILAWTARGSADRTRDPWRGKWVDVRGMAVVLRVGVPIGIATVAEVGISLAATIYAATLGAAEVAAHTLTLRMAGVVYAIPVALLQASMVRMARARTMGSPSLQPAVASSSLILSAASGVILCVALTAGAGPMAQLFFDETPAGLAAAGIAAVLLVILGAAELAVLLGAAASGLLRGR